MKITVTITVDDKGHMTVEVDGPIKGKEGLLAILGAASTLAEQSE